MTLDNFLTPTFAKITASTLNKFRTSGIAATGLKSRFVAQDVIINCLVYLTARVHKNGPLE